MVGMKVCASFFSFLFFSLSCPAHQIKHFFAQYWAKSNPFLFASHKSSRVHFWGQSLHDRCPISCTSPQPQYRSSEFVLPHFTIFVFTGATPVLMRLRD
jgi:hypothetical protein